MRKKEKRLREKAKEVERERKRGGERKNDGWREIEKEVERERKGVEREQKAVVLSFSPLD